MATYKKPLKGINCVTLGGGSFTAIDTADGNRIGSYAIEAFKAKKTVKTEDNGNEVLIPFHAIKSAHYGAMTADATKGNPYGCESGGGGKGELILTATVDTSQECSEIREIVEFTEVGTVDYADMVANPDSYSVYINDTALPFVYAGTASVAWCDADPSGGAPTTYFGFATNTGQNIPMVAVPCDVEVVNVYVAKK